LRTSFRARGVLEIIFAEAKAFDFVDELNNSASVGRSGFSSPTLPRSWRAIHIALTHREKVDHPVIQTDKRVIDLHAIRRGS
jgi:hypothetical protein